MKYLKISCIFLVFLSPIISLAGTVMRTVPLKAVIRIELYEIPEYNNFTRYLVFQDYDKNTISIAFAFRKKSYLVYEATVDPSIQDELDKFEFLCAEGNRGYWDEMRLENRGGRTALSIEHLFFELTYDKSNNLMNSNCLNVIPIIDWDIYRLLDKGHSKIDLNIYARYSRLKWATDAVKSITRKNYTYDAYTSPVFLAALRDLGKCGTSGHDEYGLNPKYALDDEELCSEFVSWYYHNEGTSIGKKAFLNVRNVSALHDIFALENRVYDYNRTSQQFEHTITGEVYQPQPGDYLGRFDTSQSHSMMIAGWNNLTKCAAVINGPWPVTIRKVDLLNDSRPYKIGRINELHVLGMEQ